MNVQVEIGFQNGDIVLKGTLSKPEMDGPFPVVIAAHTSDAGTRDFGVYQHLVKILTSCGVAVFLYDRRGTGDSTGDLESATFFDLAADMQAAIAKLKLRSDIDTKYIGLWGMSQGGWIAPLAASASKEVAFIIVVSAVGVSPAEQMSYSAECALREKQFSESAIIQMLDLQRLVNQYYRGNASFSEVQKTIDFCRNEPWFSLAYLNDSLPVDPTVTKWYHIMDFDPLQAIRSLDVPVLLLYGEHDPWVPIAKSVTRWKKYGPERLTVHQIVNANHFMVSIAHSGIRGDSGPMVEEYSHLLTVWVKDLVK